MNAIRTCSNWTTKYINKKWATSISLNLSNGWKKNCKRMSERKTEKNITIISILIHEFVCIKRASMSMGARYVMPRNCGTTISILRKCVALTLKRSHWLNECYVWMNGTNTQFSMRQIYKHRFDLIRYGST